MFFMSTALKILSNSKQKPNAFKKWDLFQEGLTLESLLIYFSF